MPYKNPEDKRLNSKCYRENNKQKISISQKEYRKNNKEKIKLGYQDWLNRNRDRFREYQNNYRKTHYNQYQIAFLGKRIIYTFRQISGYCSKCPNNVFDGSCKMTNMHHYFYLPIMIWACREELCASCHGKIGWNKQK